MSTQPRQQSIRLALVVRSLRAGVRYWAALTDSMQLAGFSVRVFTAHPPPSSRIPVQVVRGRFIRPIAQARYMNSSSVISPSLITELRRFQPDAILSVEYSLATVWSLVAARLERVPLFIFQEHKQPKNAPLPRRRLVYRRVLARLADLMFANTAAAEQEIRQDLRVPGRKVRRIQLLNPPSREELTRSPLQLSDPASRPLFLFVGELIPRKNVSTLVQAAGLVKARGEKFSLWIVGDGPERAALRSSVSTSGLDDTVSFLGAIEYDRIGWVYDKADAFVMPTLIDYRSVAVLEAMRFGKPIVDSMFDGNVGHAVLPGKNGLAFDPRSPKELSECMIRLIRDGALVTKMGEASRNMMENQSTERGTAQVYQVVQEAKRGARRDGRRK
jgi:glycosyltransferase involved in cell wall biosynthesis